MNSHQPTLATRIKVTFRDLLAKLRELVTVPTRPPLVPVRVRAEKKGVERWRNQGGH